MSRQCDERPGLLHRLRCEAPRNPAPISWPATIGRYKVHQGARAIGLDVLAWLEQVLFELVAGLHCELAERLA
jgi:hypothetical protein